MGGGGGGGGGETGGHSHLVPIPCSPASNTTCTSVNYSCLQVNKKDQKSRFLAGCA